MKRLFITLMAACAFTLASTAQTTAATAGPQLTKEEKAKLKAQQEADLTTSFKDAGLTDDQSAKAREVIADANKQNNELKKNTTLTDVQKDEQKQKILDEKNAKLKEIMGSKYKAWTAIRKEQKIKMTDGNTNIKNDPQEPK